MTKFPFLEKLELLINSFMISLVASFIRLILYKAGNFIQACLVFFGGILLGTLVGYLVDDVKSLASFEKILVAGTAIAAKEIIEFIIKDGPGLVKKLIGKKIGVDESGSSTPPHNQ